MPAPLVVGVAVKAPRIVTREPKLLVSAAGSAATAAADSVNLTLTGRDEPAGTVTLDGDAVSCAPSVGLVHENVYVSALVPELVMVSCFVSTNAALAGS